MSERQPTADQVLGRWLDALASDSPTPGGGPAAGVVGATGAALVSMVGRLTIGRERFADVEARMREIVEGADEARGRLLELADRDEEAFDGVMQALRMQRETEAERSERAAAIDRASTAAAEVPLEIARRAVEVMELATEVTIHGNPHAASDGVCAAACLHAAAHAALASVRINVRSMASPEARARFLTQVRDLRVLADRRLSDAEAAFTERLPS